ncbi:MAG TPA: S41 family peptidase [Candidatus Coprenecus stercoravium]|uniref:S41 family peptidase n=1 Tax=Candidatus Coprenecus stercoravium TaxID=2840735 RepID=A0A9D2KAH6_9BACT|nr:S41 family peptidase [Candidatus Coprenecus stercoravium]
MSSDNKYGTLRFILWSLIMLLVGSIVTKVMYNRQDRQALRVSGHGWDKLALVLQQIDANYVDTVDYAEFTEAILPLIMNELDPHSVYLPPVSLQQADQELEGKFDGIGITFNVPEDTAIVINAIPGGPSERAGIISGDRIIAVDGDTVAGVHINQDTLVSMLKGPSGSEVRLDILRDGESVVFDVTRDKIPVKSIDAAYMIDDTTGYVRLSKFTRTSYQEFEQALPGLMESGMRRLIFDLRGNTGGYLDQALLLSNEFLPDGSLIVYMEGAHRPRQDFYADGAGKCQDLSLSVLIDENSASSSEIFAGAMQDNDRADIYGRRSYGKGVVQEPIYFTDNSGIRLTVARFYTATGRCIQKPYTPGGTDYIYDIYERYRHGEMMDADSIPRNDSLRFVTPKGKVVYGGGGIIPDVFVPIDTAGVTALLASVNRQALTVKYSSEVADIYRSQLREVEDMAELNVLLDSMDLEKGFLAYMRSRGMDVDMAQWRISRDVVLTQLRALVGRYSTLDDRAFYQILAGIDNVIQTALK